jgi:hypothetical protein
VVKRDRILIVVLVTTIVVEFVVLIMLRGGKPDTAAPPTSSSVPPSPSAEQTNLAVYFHRGTPDDPHAVVAVRRSVPKTEAVATAALNELLPGPTAMFVPATAKTLKSVRVADGVAHVDFRDFRQIIPNASSSFGAAALLSELDTTLRQFPTVKSTVYSFDGDVSAFYQWLQLSPPVRDEQPAAVAEARRFLAEVTGMRVVFGGQFRPTGDGLAEVTCYPANPNDTTEPVTTLPTVVSLARTGQRWSVTGTQANVIQVDAPKTGDVLTSPLTAGGRAHVFEGNVSVRVLTDKDNTEIGRGSVTGGGDAVRPFTGQITFAQPNGGGGWVLFQELSAANGDVVLTTAVRVTFANAQPSATVHG